MAAIGEIDVAVQPGGLRDAILFAVGANATHGLRRAHADKRRAVTRLLHDPEWAAWSDREIARRCGVNHEMVGKLRPDETSGGNRQIDRPRLVERGGKTFEQNTARLGRAPTPAPASR